MTYRIDVVRTPGTVTVSFQGRLDASALNDLRIHSQAGLRHGNQVTILIRAGAEIDPAVFDDLEAIMGVTFRAESPYLVRWLEKRRKPGQD